MKRVTTTLIPSNPQPQRQMSALKMQLACAAAILAVCGVGFFAVHEPGTQTSSVWTTPLMTAFGLGILVCLVYMGSAGRKTRRGRETAQSNDIDAARYRYQRAMQELDSDPGDTTKRRHALQAEQAYSAVAGTPAESE